MSGSGFDHVSFRLKQDELTLMDRLAETISKVEKSDCTRGEVARRASRFGTERMLARYEGEPPELTAEEKRRIDRDVYDIVEHFANGSSREDLEARCRDAILRARNFGIAGGV